jgi:hypothetical protein
MMSYSKYNLDNTILPIHFFSHNPGKYIGVAEVVTNLQQILIHIYFNLSLCPFSDYAY